MENVVIVAANRTPIGKFGGSLSDVSAVGLAVTAGAGTLEKSGLSPDKIDEVIIGNVLSAGLGQNVARQVALGLDVPNQKPSFTVDMVCGSGMKAIILGVQSIQTGNAKTVLVGGTENMSQAPYLDMNKRFGTKMGDSIIIDSLLKDGLTDAIGNYHMGITAENLAEKYQLTREMQDAFAVSSQKKAQNAIENQRFTEEITPVKKMKRDGTLEMIVQDEYPRFGISMGNLAKLRPAFTPNGTVTAGNSSGINDGAAMLILMSETEAIRTNQPILARIKSYASMGVAPELMGEGPIPATQEALKKANLSMADIDLIEANEAFASQSLAVIQSLEIPEEKVNVNGGAIALGHPIGASGARIVVSLLHEMIKRQKRLGLATLCIGGGQGSTLVIER